MKVRIPLAMARGDEPGTWVARIELPSGLAVYMTAKDVESEEEAEVVFREAVAQAWASGRLGARTLG